MSQILNGEREDDLKQSAALLCNGGLLAVPTETVYGLAADASNEDAVRKVFAVKGRPLLDPLIVHVCDLEHAGAIAELSEEATCLAKTFWPGALTMVLPKKPCVPDVVTAGQPTVAVRSPAHPVMRRVLALSGLGLAAPSANPFGYVSPTTAQHVQDSLGERLAFILDGGVCEHGLESTIIDLSHPAEPKLLRPGPIGVEVLEAVLGKSIEVFEKSASDDCAQLAPGMLSKHYSPRTRMQLCAKPHAELEGAKDERIALLYLCKPSADILERVDDMPVYWCTESDALEDAARQLFALMRRLDGQGYDCILAEAAPNEGIGVAINNRLERACAS